MNRICVAVLLLLAVALSTGCSARQAGASDKAASQQPSSRPSPLTFRGLRAGQSQEEVWAVLKAGPDKQLQEIANDPGTHCEHDKRGVSYRGVFQQGRKERRRSHIPRAGKVVAQPCPRSEA